MYAGDPTFYIGTRALRCQLHSHIVHSQPLVIGTYWRPAALLIPIPPFNTWKPGEKRTALAETRRRFHRALAQLRTQS